MNAPFSTSYRLHRCRLVAACLLGFLGLALLWAGFGISEFLALQREAVADSAPREHQSLPVSLISKEQARLLQSTVDSTALSLGSVLASAPATLTEPDGRSAVASALSALTFGLGGEVYFTVWSDTRLVHSPLAPDAEGMDFVAATDDRGSFFVLRMSHIAEEGGGFLQVVLPRQFAGRDRQDAAHAVSGEPGSRRHSQELDILVSELVQSPLLDRQTPLQTTGAVIGDITDEPHGVSEAFTGMPDYCPINSRFAPDCGGRSAPPQSVDTTPVDQVVYIRRIPRCDWHIAAFMPVDARPEQGFSAAWVTRTDTAMEALEADYRKGLCVSGFSLAGLAGLMLVPGRREEDSARTPLSPDGKA